ncbi:MAG: hypothetical protein OXC26_09825 [Albidovulum sp.]|nr:hypothetical protein [Albidovulum sp.]
MPAGEVRARRIRLCFSMPPGYRNSRTAFSAYLQRMGSRRVLADMRGYMSELLAKAVNPGALDTELTAEDKE